MKQKYEVKTIFPIIKKRELSVHVPGSKSITNRALLLSTLANGTSLLKGCLFSEDSRYFMQCISNLGFDTTIMEQEQIIKINGVNGKIPKEEAAIYVGSAGTAARFLTAVLGVSNGVYYLDASEQMRKRPMLPLLTSLGQLGCHITYEEQEGHFPFTLIANGFKKQEITVNIDDSSQFLSALLIAAGCSSNDIIIRVEGTHGMSYISITAKMMEQYGVTIKHPSSDLFIIPKGQHYQAMEYQIEPDVSAACYFYALAPLLGISVTVTNIFYDSMQGDIEFLSILEKMGCKVNETPSGITVTGNPEGHYHGIQADMKNCSDQAITLAAIAPFADSKTVITGIGHIRYQESDRINAIVTELRKMGIHCEETKDSITIYPGIPNPCCIDTYEDHRMAMGFSLIGLRTLGIVIHNPLCCRKTFETYFDELDHVIKELS